MIPMEAIDLSAFDFVDFGASKGGSMEFAKKRLGGIRGLGIDIDPRKVATTRRLGYECRQGDVTALDLPSKVVRFVIISHVREHLADLASVEQAIAEAARVATDLLFIQGPCFDDDRRLERLGFRFYWSHWKGHCCHLTTSQLRHMLHSLGLQDHALFVRQPVFDSRDPSIHPVSSPIDQFEYRLGIDPPKRFVRFSPLAFREVVCFVQLRRLPYWREIVSANPDCLPLGVSRARIVLTRIIRGTSSRARTNLILVRRRIRGGLRWIIPRTVLAWRAQRKAGALRATALVLAERARATGMPQEVGPLNPDARHIVHLAVVDIPGAVSESVGDGFMKTVVITANG